MTTRANATFKVTGWDEKPYDEAEGRPKLTRAHITKTFAGDIEGEGTLEYLMMYRDDGSANFIGLERITGQIGDLAGSFVLEHTGTSDGSIATATWSVVPGSGTGDLRGLRGEGGFSSGHAESYPMTLDYEIE